MLRWATASFLKSDIRGFFFRDYAEDWKGWKTYKRLLTVYCNIITAIGLGQEPTKGHGAMYAYIYHTERLFIFHTECLTNQLREDRIKKKKNTSMVQIYSVYSELLDIPVTSSNAQLMIVMETTYLR